MFESCVKIIARDGEREILPSSLEEMQNFIVWENRSDFDDESIIGIKFILTSDGENEETCWYINPTYTNLIPEGMEYTTVEYDLRLAPESLPELILLSTQVEKCDVFTEYDAFYRELLKEDKTEIDDASKYELFLKYLMEL